MNTKIIECNEVTKNFGDKSVIDNVSFNLNPGEILSILGPSGGGKTTLLRLIAGFEILDRGEIYINGNLMSSSNFGLPPEKRSVGMVFQDYMLFPHLNVEENILFGISHLDKNARSKRLNEILDLLHLTGLEHSSPHELSGGEQQRVALGRSLAPRPSILLMDEPFSNIDANMRAGMCNEVESVLRENNVTAVFVTHDRDEAFSIGNRIAVIEKGRIEQIDVPEVLYRSPTTRFVASITSNCGFIRGKISGEKVITEIGSFNWESEEDIMDGDEVDLVSHTADFVCNLDPEGINVVQSRDFKGDETIISVKLKSGTVLPCRVNNSAGFNPGSKITLTRFGNEPLFALKKSNFRQIK